MHKFFGIWKQSVQLSWQNIKSNKMRTFLTTLGIIIGVAAVIAMITIVNSAINSVLGEFSSMGAGTLSVTATGTKMKPGLSEEDMEKIAELDNVAGLTPSININTAASSSGKMVKNVSVTGVSNSYYDNDDLIARGRGISRLDVENASYVCVIDQDMQENLFQGVDPIGKQIMLSGVSFTIIGVEGENDDLMSSFSAMGSNMDGSATIPYTVAKKISGTDKITSLSVYVKDTDYTDQLTEEIEDILYQAFNQRDDVYYVYSMDSLLDSLESVTKMLTYMLAGIASISLLVGGIGIMNMMLVSVTERTKEIGLRKAMGATPGRIQLQFLLESVVLSLIGGIIGVILGLAISLLATVILDTTFQVSVGAIALGVGFSTVVGIIFGWAPAKKASQLSPIDALRSE